TASGSLVVTNAGPDITNGTVFHLFNKAVSGLSVTLPPTDPVGANSYTWQNNITTDGSIQLISGGMVTINSNPTNIVTSVSGGVLTLSWPADHTGWTLQAQTNPLTIGISNDWYNVTGSSSTDMVNMVLDPNTGSVFFRLYYLP